MVLTRFQIDIPEEQNEKKDRLYYYIAVLKGKRKGIYTIKKAVHYKYKRTKQGH